MQDPLVERVAYYYQDRMARRVAARFMFESSLHAELHQKMGQLLEDYTPERSKQVAEFLRGNFRFDVAKTPQGQRDLKDYVVQLHSALETGSKSAVQSSWGRVGGQSGDLVRYFSSDGDRIIPKEVQAGGNTYLNQVGYDQKRLGQFVTSVEAIFDGLVGWRRKALTGGVRIALSRACSSPAFYHEGEDTLYVKALPALLRRSNSYGSCDYNITHELGRRFACKQGLESTFETPEWMTTKLSSHQGRSFGELFALTNFGLAGPWDQTVLARFEHEVIRELAA